jgi:hypothetical protein
MKIRMINKMFAKMIRERDGKEIKVHKGYKGEREDEGRTLIFGD